VSAPPLMPVASDGARCSGRARLGPAHPRSDQGFAMLIADPVLSPSGSWLADGSNVQPPFARPVTVKVTLEVAVPSFRLVTVHLPFVDVVQELVPPVLQLPVTTTPPSAVSLAV
jgi:hypothetical protein